LAGALFRTIWVGPLIARYTGVLVDTPHNSITKEILGSAIEVHRALGPGLLESVYTACLHYELSARGLRWRAQQPIPIIYKGIALDVSYRVDLIIEDYVVVEVKSVDKLSGVHDAQLLTYLRLTESPVGLLINFNVAKLMDGMRRLLNPRAKNAAFGAQ
jgi:GxxExxY protein